MPGLSAQNVLWVRRAGNSPPALSAPGLRETSEMMYGEEAQDVVSVNHQMGMIHRPFA